MASYAFRRVRPTKFRTVGSISAAAPLLPGEGVVIPFTTAALALNPNGLLWVSSGTAGLTLPKYVTVKTTQDVAFAFGPIGMADAGNGDALLQAGDSWQDWEVQPGDAGVSLKGITQAGNFYVLMATP